MCRAAGIFSDFDHLWTLHSCCSSSCLSGSAPISRGTSSGGSPLLVELKQSGQKLMAPVEPRSTEVSAVMPEDPPNDDKCRSMSRFDGGSSWCSSTRWASRHGVSMRCTPDPRKANQASTYAHPCDHVNMSCRDDCRHGFQHGRDASMVAAETTRVLESAMGGGAHVRRARDTEKGGFGVR